MPLLLQVRPPLLGLTASALLRPDRGVAEACGGDQAPAGPLVALGGTVTSTPLREAVPPTTDPIAPAPMIPTRVAKLEAY
jgi:hypothetical protein